LVLIANISSYSRYHNNEKYSGKLSKISSQIKHLQQVCKTCFRSK